MALATVGATTHTSQQQVTQGKVSTNKLGKLHEFCKDSEHGIVYYRNVTWHLQDKQDKDRSNTTYPERRKNACPYKRYEAKVWWNFSSTERDSYDKWLAKQAEAKRLANNVEYAICKVFGPYCKQALEVSWCESRHHTTSQNGQYLGLFQMGNYARSKYGHSSTAYGQALAAYHYFVDSGRDWSPWSCKPY